MWHIDIKIAVLPVVKAYLQKNHNVDPFELSQDNKYGIFLYNCLAPVKKTSKPVILKRSQDLTALDISTTRYTETLKIRLTERAWRKKGSFIHPDMQRGFNRMVMYDLDELLCLWVDTYTQLKGCSLKYAFLKFREKFGLSEDNLTLKTMEKKYERYRYKLSA